MDYHILDKSTDNRYCTLYAHLPIPATKNVAGTALSDDTLTYQRALKEKLEQENIEQGGDGTITSKVPDIASAELTAMQTGEIVERYVNFRFDSLELTNTQRKDQIENGNVNEIGVAQMKIDIADSDSELYKEIIEPLAWWGYHADIS